MLIPEQSISFVVTGHGTLFDSWSIRNDGTIVNKSEVKTYQKYAMVDKMFYFMDSVKLNQGFIVTKDWVHSFCIENVPSGMSSALKEYIQII